MASRGTRTTGTDTAAGVTGGRSLGVAGFVVLVVVYLVVIQGGAQLLTIGKETGYASVPDVDTLWRTLLVPIGASFLLVYGAVAYLGWWKPVFVEHRPVQRWVLVIPVLMVVSIVVVTDYGALADHGALFTVLLLLTMLMVGFAEEGMFRGIGLTVFRNRGFSEGKVALWTTVLFGLSHASNLITEGPKAFLQVLATIVAGYFFYLLRRLSGGLVVPAVLHGLWDFSLVSGQTTGEVYRLSLIAILVDVVIAVVVLTRRKHVEPRVAATP